LIILFRIEKLLLKEEGVEPIQMTKEPTTNSTNIFSHFNCASEAGKSELEQYLKEDNVNFTNNDDVITYWKERRNKYPKLTEIVLKNISVPASSAGIERVFSQSKLILSDVRNRLGSESFEKLLLIKNWS
jgi:hypothetical protein